MDMDDDWEEWNPSQDSFLLHATAGSLAGVVEHTAIFPLDTIKTIRQTTEPGNRVNIRSLVKNKGMLRMWRGMPVTFSACIPAHAAYFSVYEAVKARLGVDDPGHRPVSAAAAGAFATIVHDLIMTPLDVVKQRLQLGYYNGVVDCVRHIVREEGIGAFLRSYPTTLGMNIPYAATVVATNETMKKLINPSKQHSMSAFLISGGVSGALAACVTTPLDVVKTRLQTQRLALQGPAVKPVAASGRGFAGPSASAASALGAAASRQGLAGAQQAVGGAASFYTSSMAPAYRGFTDAVHKIYTTEGVKGFWRGLKPRLLLQTPSVAISWGTYEYVKNFFKKTTTTY